MLDARVVAVSSLSEHVQPPEVLGAEPAVGYPVPQHRPSGGVLQRLAGTVDILPEESRRHLFDAAVVVALACHFVTPVRHLSHQLGCRFRHPSKDKERRPYPELVQHVQGPVGADFEPPLEPVHEVLSIRPLKGEVLIISRTTLRRNFGSSPSSADVRLCGRLVACKAIQS